MCGFKIDRRRTPLFPRFLPSRCTQAPPVSWIEPRKSEFWPRCRKVVASISTERQERFIDYDTDGMHASIRIVSVATPVTEPASERFFVAGLQWGPKDVDGWVHV